MALHPLELPPRAALLFRVVALLKRLLKALADPALNASNVDTLWVQQVWNRMDAEWVRRFCLGGQAARIQAMAETTPTAREVLYDEFCRQNKVRTLLEAGGNFRAVETLPDVDAALAKQVREFFKHCYDRLGHNTDKEWFGYEFSASRAICKSSYSQDFCSRSPASDVCPYCDCDISGPVLDHYLPKSSFPLLACSPWNLVPICVTCNSANTGKGDSAPITKDSPRPMDDWLHPLFRPASSEAHIRLSGTPRDSIPRLHASDKAEQVRLDNHFELVQTQTRALADRWTKRASSYFDKLVRDVRREVGPTRSVDDIVRGQLEAHRADRGKVALSMIHAAVCEAILDRRPEYREEFDDPNEVALA